MIGFEELSEVDGEGVLQTKDINGNGCEFFYKYGKVKNEQYNKDGIVFKVFAKGKSPYKTFEAILIEHEDKLKIVMITTNEDPDYKQKGIPEYLIPEIGKIFKKDICSSSTVAEHQSYDGENRVPEASKYWKRLHDLKPAQTVQDTPKGMFIYLNI